MNEYDHKKIEKKWQKFWQTKKIYKTSEKYSNPKCYVLDMFPYPSGEGLHVGHPKGYIATDIYSRFKRMNGFNVLHPMGWDAFGLPAENYALKHKIHPKIAVDKNIKRYKEQLSILGFNYDWKREINTTDPKYYKWTQWIFLQMFKNGLAYESHEPINWCPSCKTGLANEDLEDGRCERCGSAVEKKPMRQWFLKITEYAERLLKDLDKVIWPQEIKEQQMNWIGKSEGAEINFRIKLKNKKIRFVILHGYTGSPQKNFIPWLKNELEKRGHIVEAPELPDSKNPKEEEQVGYAIKNCHFDENTVVIGHSLGSVVAIKTLMELKKRISGLVLVAPAIDSKFHTAESRTFWKNFKWNYNYELIKKLTGGKIAILSDTKEKFSVPYLKHLSKKLEALLIETESNRDHFCALEEPAVLKSVTPQITVFTTRPDTIFGATYLVLAPEHPWVSELLESVENKSEIENYINQSKKKTEMERTTEGKIKTGVELKGIKAINPANDEEILVWIADYVLPQYGAGAIMAVPAHDERDYAFAKKFNLPIRQVIAPHVVDTVNPPIQDKKNTKREIIHAIVKHPKENKFIALHWKKFPWRTFITGGIEEGEDEVQAAKREIEEETGYINIRFVKKMPFVVRADFYAPHKDVNREVITHVLFFELQDLNKKDVAQEEKGQFDTVWEDFDKLETLSPVSEIKYVSRWIKEGDYPYIGEGLLINSKKFNGLKSEETKEKITKFVGGKKKTTYKLRDWVFSRQRYWGEPIPLVHCDKCGVVAVSEKDLPVELPEVKNYEPTGTGESPLANIKNWINVKCPKCKSPAKRETNTMPQWAGSCWYYLRYMDPRNKKVFIDKNKEKYWSPVDMYVGGAEHATRHLIYARFWHKFLHDIGVVSTSEPFMRLHNVGLVLAPNGRKMSKRYGNVINPDDIVKTYGADTFRVYEMFMGPFHRSATWSADSIIGPRRFLEKIWKQGNKLKVEPDNAIETLLHQTIKKVTKDIENFNFNTAISSLMILANEFETAKKIGRGSYETLLRLFAPFAPHITEEIWCKLGNKKSIHLEIWPRYDQAKIISKNMVMAVQINGKVRTQIEVPADISEKEIKKMALSNLVIKKWVKGKEIRRFIYIKKRLINIVI